MISIGDVVMYRTCICDVIDAGTRLTLCDIHGVIHTNVKKRSVKLCSAMYVPGAIYVNQLAMISFVPASGVPRLRSSGKRSLSGVVSDKVWYYENEYTCEYDFVHVGEFSDIQVLNDSIRYNKLTPVSAEILRKYFL